jgi:hypothetical protein
VTITKGTINHSPTTVTKGPHGSNLEISFKSEGKKPTKMQLLQAFNFCFNLQKTYVWFGLGTTKTRLSAVRK